ncbi:hypothetical protein BJP34_24615 [Moorena producens PAL-8-15-08-1]|uniref:Peptidase S8/S53 domain-containing protein n=1 Tax=Moorena producens PAL-8-15-08-1 TaxID=1458985 RepID=A0A1D8TX25_9CYAN|nr:S8 family serine peptidase [Moorena producens]AOX02197.1 hypothetical protein BJP34_24615 [Moorena producens PAL-8-15-08-1]
MIEEKIHIGLIDTGVDPEYMGLFREIEAFQDIDESGNLTEKTCYDKANHGTYTAALLTKTWPTNSKELSNLPEVSIRLHVCAAITKQNVVSNLLHALEWMLSQPIQILVLPLGIVEQSPIFESHLQLFIDQGVLPIVAVGNDGAGRSRSPGYYPSVLSIGACSWTGEIPAFSGSAHLPGLQQCIKPDLVAPGVKIPFQKNGKQVLMDGTSMACAIAARYAAWLWQQNPECSSNEIKQGLIQSSHPLKSDQKHRCRFGYLNPEKAQSSLRLEEVKTSNNEIEQEKGISKSPSWIDPKLKQQGSENSQKIIILIMLYQGNTIDSVLEKISFKLIKSFPATPIFLIEAPRISVEFILKNPSIRVAQSPYTSLISLSHS